MGEVERGAETTELESILAERLEEYLKVGKGQERVLVGYGKQKGLWRRDGAITEKKAEKGRKNNHSISFTSGACQEIWARHSFVIASLLILSGTDGGKLVSGHSKK